MHQPINSTPPQPPVHSTTQIFSHVRLFWRLVGIYQCFGHINTARVQKLPFPSSRSKFWHCDRFSYLDFLTIVIIRRSDNIFSCLFTVHFKNVKSDPTLLNSTILCSHLDNFHQVWSRSTYLFLIYNFFTPNTLCHAVTLTFCLWPCHVIRLCTKFERNRTLRGWVIAIYRLKIWAPSAILNLTGSGLRYVLETNETRNSSADEIANVNFYDDIAHVLRNTQKKRKQTVKQSLNSPR